MQKFLWGAATSSHQIEGYNKKNDWWAWEKAGRIEGGVSSGAAVDHWNRYREDLELAASLGLNSYRFSIEWSRVEPVKGEWDESALERYEEIVSECERLGLVPMLTLLHFTLPVWLADEGGFCSPDSAALFLRYVKKVVDRLGPRIPLWCTVNEPVVLAVGAYLGKFMPPGEYAPKKVTEVLANLLKAHVLAYDCIHRNIKIRAGAFKEVPLAVGIAHNMLFFLPERRWHPGDRILAHVFDRFYNWAFLDAVFGKKQKFGVLGLLPVPDTVHEAIGRVTVDFVGVNYYTKACVQWRPHAPAADAPSELPIGVVFARRGEKVSDLGWSIFPQGFRKILRRVSEYGKPIYITENGIADREDRYRSEYITLHLKELETARKKGIDIRGYYHWSLMDNFEWIKGFGPRFGLFRVDYETLARTPTKGAEIYAKWIRRNSALISIAYWGIIMAI